MGMVGPMGGGMALAMARGRGEAAPPPSSVPANTALPVISGTPQVGETLTASGGSFTNGPFTRARQWYADEVAIEGATLSTLLLTEDHEGAEITHGVIATNVVGASEEAVSEAVGPVDAEPVEPVNLVAPVMTLTVEQDVWPITFDLSFDATTLSTDEVRLQVAEDEAFATLALNTTSVVGTGAIVFAGLSEIDSGEHFLRARVERGEDTSEWSNVLTHGDTTAPVLSSPEGEETSDTTADLAVTTDTGEGVLYIYVSASATPPGAGDLKTGTGAAWSGSQSVTGAGEQAAEATGLTPSTTYYAHFLHTDTAGNDSETATSASFETEASTAPVTLDATKKGTNINLVDGDMAVEGLQVQVGALRWAFATVPVPAAGKQYAEFVADAVGSNAQGLACGVGGATDFNGAISDGVQFRSDGNIRTNDSHVTNLTAWSDDDVIMVAVDAGAELVWFGRNGVWNGDPAAGTGGISYATAGKFFGCGAMPLDDGVQKITARFAAGDQTYSPPAGFGPVDSAGEDA